MPTSLSCQSAPTTQHVRLILVWRRVKSSANARRIALQAVYPCFDHITATLPLDQTALSQLWNDQISVFCATLDGGLQGKNIRLLDDHRNDLAPEIAAHIERGRTLRAVDLQLLDFERTKVLDAVEDIFDTYDLLICPTTGVSGVPNANDGHTLGPREINGHPVDPTIGWCLTHSFNFTGHPATSIPACLDKGGLLWGCKSSVGASKI